MRFSSATYRIQFNPSFTFQDAEGIVDYLCELGISDLYASPIFEARKGSAHGYDVTDPNQINPELGGQGSFERLVTKLKGVGMGWLQDIVPNHMAYDPENRMLMDVLEKGSKSSYFDFFDISWQVAHEEVKGKLLAPFLDKPYRQALKNGEIRLEGSSIVYHNWRFPLRPGSLEKIGEERGSEALDRLLRDQLYKLAYWRSASEESNYRRFFNIDGLISLKPEAFDKTHELVFKLASEGKFTGLRIDHIDGLFDPADYLARIREKAGDAYVLVEKILTGNEILPKEWPVEGTTGYDYLNRLNGIFCDTGNQDKFNKIYAGFTGIKASCADLRYEKKKSIVERHMFSKVNYLARLLKRFLDLKGVAEKLGLAEIRALLVELLACFPVYRTYISEKEFSRTDLNYLKQAVEEAKGRRPEILGHFDVFERAVELFFSKTLSRPARKRLTYFLMRLQQYTGPIMAKGFEDTLLYNYNRLLSLNEVGGSPESFGISLGDFHIHNKRISDDWPNTMLSTSTHDTKRGEDVRARLNVLSEIPEEWGRMLKEWSGINKGVGAPDANEEYFIYQTLIGAFPFDMKDYPEFVERIKQYMLKALREAKAHTSWLKPDKHYEKAALNFIDKILADPEKNKFLKSFLPFQKKIAFYGIFNSLSQTIIKLTSPGVPDIYQGAEVWDLSLVDPDNRRPVDFAGRKALLQEIKKITEEELLASMGDGRIKLYVINMALHARGSGEYIPLTVAGKFKDNIIAFARGRKVTVAPRFLTRVVKEGELPIGKVWADTSISLPDGKILAVADVLEKFPVALHEQT